MNFKKISALVLAVLILALSLCGCSSNKQRTIQLEDANVGVVLYKSEFQAIGNNHPDFKYGEISYFDEYYDAQMALTANRIDTFYCEKAAANEMLRSTGSPDDYHIYKVPMSSEIWLSNWCSPSAKGADGETPLSEEYRAWLEEFKKTDTYADIVKRAYSTRYEMYEEKKIDTLDPADAVKTLKIGYVSDGIPYCQINSDGTPYGPNIEVICHFANDMGYAVELSDMIVPTAIPLLMSGRLDMFFQLSAYSEAGAIINMNPMLVQNFMLYPTDFVLVTRSDTVIEGLEEITE